MLKNLFDVVFRRRVKRRWWLNHDRCPLHFAEYDGPGVLGVNGRQTQGELLAMPVGDHEAWFPTSRF